KKYQDPMVLAITHAPRLHLFVAYCDDVHFRFFADHTRDFKLLLDSRSPYSITSMCFNPATGELVTGAIGTVIFWSLATEEGLSMGVAQEVPIASGEFVHALSLEQEQKVLLALCENVIRVYDSHSRALIRAFQVSQGVSLTCCSANWSQSFLYTGDLAGDVKVWNFGTGGQVSQFKAHLSAITSIISRIPVHTLMTASLDGLLKEWNVTTCELLRRVDIGEEVFQMQFITEQTFFLRTQFTFTIRTVNNFYQLFNRTKSMLKGLVRVQCGPERARILATTEDGVVRFLSPITGEMLFITWPFQLLEKALDTVYDPDREELLVTMGTTDIYALDTSKNPCPVKYILRAADSVEDKVLCLAYSRLDLEGRTSSFIFSGFKSGRVRTVTQQLYRMGSRKLHDGNVVALSSISAAGSPSPHTWESSYLCSYGLDEYIILSNVVLKKNRLLEVVPLVAIASTNCRIHRLLLIPGYICVLTEQNRVRLWRHGALVPGKKNPFWKETATLHPTSITSFDYCHPLGMLVTGGSDGSVRIWDILGQLLVEFDTSLKFSRVCFANQRGDLVVGCNMNIFFISCVTYLPSKQLGTLLAQRVRDDAVELPLPFVSRFLLSFDIVFVPNGQAGEEVRAAGPGRSWPIAPDGYVPNSVVRARLFPKGTPEALRCSLLQSRDPLPKRRVIKIQLPEGDTSEAAEKARKKKAHKMRHGTSSAEGPRRGDLLSDLVAKPWLRHKPSDTTLPSVVEALLSLMDDVPYSSYVLCTSALVQLAEAYALPSAVQERAFDRLILDTTHKEVGPRAAPAGGGTGGHRRGCRSSGDVAGPWRGPRALLCRRTGSPRARGRGWMSAGRGPGRRKVHTGGGGRERGPTWLCWLSSHRPGSREGSPRFSSRNAGAECAWAAQQASGGWPLPGTRGRGCQASLGARLCCSDLCWHSLAWIGLLAGSLGGRGTWLGRPRAGWLLRTHPGVNSGREAVRVHPLPWQGLARLRASGGAPAAGGTWARLAVPLLLPR
uniref:Uncharacterized protein n=1 Tax=Varanus komodoensis TaxID=61221 RepID=A0A8D2IPB6_VARKO